jgi:predicted ArsR family transcriptional regulator
VLLALTREEMTAQEVAKQIRCRVGTVRTTLTRLHRYGQVSRKKIQRGTVVVDKDEGIERPRFMNLYAITEKGHKRLEQIVGKGKT